MSSILAIAYELSTRRLTQWRVSILIAVYAVANIVVTPHCANADWVVRHVEAVYGAFDNMQPRSGFDENGNVTDFTPYILGEGTYEISWGDPFPGFQSSSLSFLRDNFQEAQAVLPGQTFFAGTIYFGNGDIQRYSSTAQLTVDLNVQVSGVESQIIEFPWGTGTTFEPFEIVERWGITIVQTVNQGVDPVADADYIYFSAFPSLGKFLVYEGDSAHVGVFARFGSVQPAGFGQVFGGGLVVTDEPAAVPEPGSLTLIGTGLLTLVVATRFDRRVRRFVHRRFFRFSR